MFRIKDLTFEIKSATCAGILAGDGSLDWSIHVDAVRTNATALGDVAPRISFNRLWHPDDAERSLRELRWSGVSAYEKNDWIGDIRVIEEEMFYDSEVELDRVACDQFELRWQGVCDVKWNQDYGMHLPFSVETPLLFTGIVSYITQEDAARRALARYCDEEMFAFMDDIEKGRAVFLPLLD